MGQTFRLLSILLLIHCVFGDDDGDKHCPALFDQYDADHQHGLDKAEFKNIFLPTFDTEFPADGQLSRDEVVNGWRNGYCDFRDTRDGLLIFLETDVDRDMFVTETDLDHIFAGFDKDHNGYVSPNEFRDGWNARYGRDTLNSIVHHH
ncbi:uncharacterized protein LOC133197067 [Saccostrea echinata]|uniref:uncharacterized protein LOC133197067 n=1 Tax=Saccostrea echinata TaxID=191078 RepID=UPI002A7F1565|nr:uncharacterized protein LOC133197067 [Saccostrea echinata]